MADKREVQTAKEKLLEASFKIFPRAPCLHERTYEPIILRKRKRSRLDIVFLQFKTFGEKTALHKCNINRNFA